MIISRNWLQKYISLPQSVDELTRILTFSGIEVEAVQELPALPDSIVTARIVSAEHIEGSDHLKVCQVDTGNGASPVQVVCGAPNCVSGMIGVLALPGTILGEIQIKQARLRGVESSGMLCSERELSISEDHAGIISLPEGTPIGQNVNELFGLPDVVFELEITPNRPDLLGYFGIARDLSASLGVQTTFPKLVQIPGGEDSTMGLNLFLEDKELCPRYTARLMRNVKVGQSPQWMKNALLRSGLRPINNVVDITNYVMLETGHPLHAFDYDKLKKRIDTDAYPAVVIRRAADNEQIEALDGGSYKLRARDLVIADGADPSAIAGVIGGKNSAISDETTRIVLESAAFAPGSVRKTSYDHKISTDSAYRFERHLTPEMAAHVSARATDLLRELAGAEPIGELMDAYPAHVEPLFIGIRPQRFSSLIGFTLSEEEIKGYLQKLGCRFVQYGDWQAIAVADQSEIVCYHAEQEKQGVTEFDTDIDCQHALWFSIPPWRVDLQREVDLIEELARLAGYDKVPSRTTTQVIMDSHAHSIRGRVLEHFLQFGFYEVLNYSFIDPEQMLALGFASEELESSILRLKNPQSSNQAAMRVSLVPQLLDNLRYNLNHGERDIRLMELAKVYHKNDSGHVEPYRLSAVLTGKETYSHWSAKSDKTGFWHLKGIVEDLFAHLDIIPEALFPAEEPYLVKSESLSWKVNGRSLASIGILHPAKADSFGIDVATLKQDIWVVDIDLDMLIDITRRPVMRFQELPRFPMVERDLSLQVPSGVDWTSLKASILEVDTNLITDVEVFDEYRGKQISEGYRSISMHIFAQDREKTLTDERVEQLIESVVKMLDTRWQIKMR